MQIVSRYLVAETVKSQIAVFFVLMTIFVTQKFVRVLADASEGDIPASLVIGFLALKLPALATMIIPLSLFLGILISHGRFYVDSEMAVMQACGISEWYVLVLCWYVSCGGPYRQCVHFMAITLGSTARI